MSDIVRSVSGSETTPLDSAIAGLYGGALEDFVRRRDALAKELRTAGDKDFAATVKALRKPSRMAWALDVAALDKFGAIETVVAAVERTVAAHSAGGDVWAAIANMRAAVRDFAGKAAAAAAEAGQRLEPAELSNALFAVIGKPESFQQLRRGHLADVPEAGGLDLLASLPSSLAPMSAPPPVQSPEAGDTAETSHDAELVAAAQEAVRRAGAVLADARQRSEASRQALAAAESSVELTELQLRKAEVEVRAARAARDRASEQASMAAAQVRDGETALGEAEQALSRLTRS